MPGPDAAITLTLFLVNPLYILWTANPEVLHSLGLDTGFDFRWYGLLFASGFLFGQYILGYILKHEGKPASDLDTITMYMIVAVVLGARLGHCLFYEPDVYLADPIRILKIWEGGLASHGATVGILFAIWLYSRKRRDQPYLWVLDRIVITVALGGALIRMGNLMNSEIIGKPTDDPWAFVFARPAAENLAAYHAQAVKEVKIEGLGTGYAKADGAPRVPLTLTMPLQPILSDTAVARNYLTRALSAGFIGYNEDVTDHVDLSLPPRLQFSGQPGAWVATATLAAIPRHPAQLYEAITTFLVFLLLWGLWWRQRQYTPVGSLFGWFVTCVFGLRFLYEFLKENQVQFEDELALNMGQWLSLPLIPLGIGILIYSYTRRPLPPGVERKSVPTGNLA